MPNHIRHFAINCDDVPRARRFYEKVFGWKFSAWGPPDFFKIATGNRIDSGLEGAIQKRREIVPGKTMFGYECSISVDDIDAISSAIQANGGRIVMSKVTIPTVGTLIFFEDTE